MFKTATVHCCKGTILSSTVRGSYIENAPVHRNQKIEKYDLCSRMGRGLVVLCVCLIDMIISFLKSAVEASSLPLRSGFLQFEFINTYYDINMMELCKTAKTDMSHYK